MNPEIQQEFPGATEELQDLDRKEKIKKLMDFHVKERILTTNPDTANWHRGELSKLADELVEIHKRLNINKHQAHCRAPSGFVCSCVKTPEITKCTKIVHDTPCDEPDSNKPDLFTRVRCIEEWIESVRDQLL